MQEDYGKGLVQTIYEAVVESGGGKTVGAKG